MNTITIEMQKDRETKSTVRYAEDGDEPVIGTLYVRKHAVRKLGEPDKITVTITTS